MNKQSERGNAVLEFAVVAGLILLVVYGMGVVTGHGTGPIDTLINVFAWIVSPK